MVEDISRELCERIATWSYEDLPADVVHKTKLLLIDSLGAIGGAANAPGVAELNGRLTKWETGGAATGLIGHRRYAPPSAALANGTAAHALDFDDQHDPARVHVFCVLLPTLLAASEELGNVSGRDFLLAAATGAELHARLGLACYNCVGRGWHPTMVLGVLAASLAAGRLLRLDPAGLLRALGLAHHQAAGSIESAIEGVLSKRLGAGIAARAAVTAAFLAADGIGGPSRPLEGKAGLFRLQMGGEVKPEILISDLGERWHLRDFSFKPYPCCRCNHMSIDLAFDLRSKGVRSEQVEEIEIALAKVNFEIVGEPYDPKRDSIVHAQFNVSYNVARALADGKVGLAAFQRPQITDPAIAALTARTRVVIDPQWEPTALEPARIRVTTKDGRSFEAYGDKLKGSPRNPMSEAELVAKFRACLEFGLGTSAAEADRYAETVLRLESARDVGLLARDFPGPRR